MKSGRVYAVIFAASSFEAWHEWFGMLLLGGNGLLFYVLYRNRWQFKGWYRSASTQLKLRRPVTTGCVAAAVLLISSPIFLFWI
ncbi:hypothetical protein [Paenibacillus sp. DMB20]|uniref:hypothetical protein n=1 Tax=Paenibacillus sp. DMB20 TaxID=1642570 RepID=UPI000627B940|nr:hypothetical protein [Paenibacillus sp. DMB20]KKO53390.1 hypothetical protein XI25_13950 [Paenibacillus sp. DMB20]